MDNCIESVTLNSVDELVNDSDSFSDDTSVIDGSDISEQLLLIKVNPINTNDVICCRNLNHINGSQYTMDCDNCKN